MGSLLALLRATRRSGGRGLVGLALIIGLAGGAVLTGVEAYRRTDSAFDRLVEDTQAWDVLVNPDEGTTSRLRMDDIAALPMVASVARFDGIALGPRTIESIEELDSGGPVFASDGQVAYEFGRPLIRAGRLPHLDAPDEALVSSAAARAMGLEVGDEIAARLLDFDDFEALGTAGSAQAGVDLYNDPSTGVLIDLDVVGIGDPYDEIVVDEGFSDGSTLLTPAFVEVYEPAILYWGGVARLRPGADEDQFRAAVEGLVPDEAIAFQSRRGIQDQADRAVAAQVAALGVFSAIAAVVGLVIVGQAISRRLQADAVALGPMAALGVTRPQRAALGIVRIAFAAVVGAGLAAVIALVASPLAPVGVARDLEPDPGVRVDLPVLVLGGLAVALVFIAVAVRPAIVATRRHELRAIPSAPGAWAAAAGLAPSMVAGVRFALDRGGSGVPARATLAGAATSIALIAGTLAFSASLNHLVETPADYGTPWAAVVQLEGDDEATAEDYLPVTDGLLAADGVEAFGLLYPGQLRLDGQSFPAVSIQPSARPIAPTVLDGRAPAARDEVAVGLRTLDELGVDVGDRVTARRGGEEADLTVVGTVVLPAIGSYSGADKTTLGEGVLAAQEVLTTWGPSFDPYGVVVAADSLRSVDELVAGIEVPEPLYLTVTAPSLPSDVQSLERVRSTPLWLTALLAALIALTVAHALVAAVRSRRQEIAVLRTLGFTRRQVLSSIAIQAGLIALVGLVIGIPIGLVAGRVAWTVLAERLGAVVELITPFLALGLLAAAVLILALVVGLVPGLRAARAHPADTLRTE